MWIRHQSTLHKHMVEVMDTEADTMDTEVAREALTINTEVEDTKTTKTMVNLSTWMTEEISSGTIMETQSTRQRNMMQPLPFILQGWKVTEVVEAEEVQEGEEDLIKDMDQVEEQEEDPIKDMDQAEEQVEDLAKDMDQAEEQIEEQKEDLIEDMDPIEDQGKDQIEDMDQAEEQEGELNTDKVDKDIATFAKNVDTIHYSIAQSS